MAHSPEFFLSSLYTMLPEAPPHAASEYDFLIIQIPTRCISSDSRLWRLAYEDAEGHRRAFDEACAAIDLFVDNHLAWTVRFGIPAFVTNFFLPQGDLTGRLLPRYDLRNIVHFYEELNRHIEASIKRYPRAYLLDIDRIAGSFGRRFVQDDGVLWTKHGSVMPTEWPVETRIKPMPAMRDHYEVTWPSYFVAAVWAEAMAMHRTMIQVDPVKLVVLDLDDTLWMGVSGDDAQIGAAMVESWPLGIAEALMYLKKRGTLLAIISKNDEKRIRTIWPSIFGTAITPEDFAVVRINWRRKSENMKEILEAVNLLSRSAVFIDDNPVERAEMESVFPEMRILGRYPFYLRRTLLWSSETQVESISFESASRTQMVHAQIEREASRQVLDRRAFLLSLDLRVVCYAMSAAHPRFKRAHELLNKTNQFNTTGRRWTHEELEAFLRIGGLMFAFDVTDKFTVYGLVGLCLVNDGVLEQFVMSCRVNGLDVEIAALSAILDAVRAGHECRISARFVETSSNLLCRELWSRCGFMLENGDWVLADGATPSRPDFISLRRE